MSYTVISAADPTPDALRQFWTAISGEGIRSVRIDVDRETAGITATSSLWSESGRGPIGVRLGMYNVLIRWEKITESSITDEEWELVTGEEASNIIRAVENTRPEQIDATYNLDGIPFVPL